MKIITWNVNGIRSLKKSIDTVLKELSADVACFQETKVSRNQLPETIALVDGYSSFFSYPRKQSGYSGVASYCKDNFVPEDAEEGLPQSFCFEKDDYAENLLHNLEMCTTESPEFDHEGRVMITYHLVKYADVIQPLAIINVYCPRVDPEKLDRHLYKIEFCCLLELKMRELCKKGCFVIIVGDLNIAASLIDHCGPGDEEEFNSSEARKWLKSFLSSTMPFCGENTGVADAFRYFYPEKKEAYTCWNTKTGARSTNFGTRIDYIIISSNLLPILQSCEILSDYHGSDHCPVSAVLKCDAVPHESVQLPSICTRLWPEFSGQQQKLQVFFQKAQAIADKVTKHTDFSKKSDTHEHTVRTNKSVAKKNKQKSITNFFRAPNNAQNNYAIPTDTHLSNCKKDLVSNTTIVSSLEMSSQNEIPVLPDQETVNNDKYDEISSSPQNKQSSLWKSMLTGPPKPPVCTGHGKESVLRTVRKKGPNCGRQFFMCAQPTGHPSNPESNCNFFKWAFSPKVNKLKKP